MQDRVICSNMGTNSNTCVDILTLDFPGVNDCERCGERDDPLNANCPDQSGLGNEMFVEFISNRETNFRGFEILAHCVEPGFDQNIINPNPNGNHKRRAVECTLPDGNGPRYLPPVPLVSLVNDRLCIIIYSQQKFYGFSHTANVCNYTCTHSLSPYG